MTKPILCLDFDGVLHSYTSGWKGADVIPDPPVAKMVPFLERAIREFDVQIFSSRTGQPGGLDAMKQWIDHNVMLHFGGAFADPPELERGMAIVAAIGWPTEKPPAMVTLDDRAIQFNGTWPSIAWLKAFQPWYKQVFGATGSFPMPALNDDDEGELRMGVTFDPVDGIVRLEFGKPIAWIGLPPEGAIELAKTLLKHAGAKTVEITI